MTTQGYTYYYNDVTLASEDLRQIFQVVNYVILCGLISVFGIVSNIVNIIVFCKQGFKDRINISWMGLAIADLFALITMFWSSVCYNPYVINYPGLPYISLDIMYLTAGWPHACFNRITSFITAFITFERCLCIALPLKVKNIITPFRTKCIIIAIFLLMFIVFSPFYFVNKLVWIYNQQRNTTILSLVYTQNREIVESVTFFIHSVAMPAFSFATVIVCTAILVAKLNSKNKWRTQVVTRDAMKSSDISVKEKKTVKLVILISTIFIVCYLPATVIFFMMAYEPEFSFSGKYQNIFFVVWSVAFVLETINSSVNILVYFNMSSKYRMTVGQIFYVRTHKDGLNDHSEK